MFTAKKNRQADKDGKQPPVSMKKRLSRADRKQIEAAIARANRTDRKEKSAQDSIPYERMWPDGICRVADGHYTKTIQFQDINYQLSQNEEYPRQRLIPELRRSGYGKQLPDVTPFDLIHLLLSENRCV